MQDNMNDAFSVNKFLYLLIELGLNSKYTDINRAHDHDTLP